MAPSEPTKILESLTEELAENEHARWAHWQRYLHDQGQRQADGSLVLPRDLVDRWEKQIATAYASLSEAEKESDREQVRQYLPIVAKAFSLSNRSTTETVSSGASAPLP